MIGICQKCGNHKWDKIVDRNRIKCPRCGNSWEFQKLPLFILTGCSGVGKTTTAQQLQKMRVDFTVLDADMFYNIMPHETEQDYYAQVEQVLSLSKNIAQSGKTVLWAMAGNIDKINHAIGDMPYKTLNTENQSVQDVAEKVKQIVVSHCNP